MTNKLYAIVGRYSRSRVYVVEAETPEQAADILAKAVAINPDTPSVMCATTAEEVMAIGETSMEDLRNGLDLANTIPENVMVHQDNVHEDDLPQVIIREEGIGLAEPNQVAADPFSKVMADLQNFQPNNGKIH